MTGLEIFKELIPFQIIEELLDVDKMPRKPQYTMASGKARTFYHTGHCLFSDILLWMA